MNVEVIPATAADVEVLARMQQQAFKRLYDVYHDEGSPYLRGPDEILRWLERPNWQVCKILADDVLCGGVAFCEHNSMPGVYYLARIYVSPEFQGKGIASTALLLCEKKVANANCWTLDFPIAEPANRRCYEKAGYIDTGERREQSDGAITLAYMEKRIPAFRDLKNHLDNVDIHAILADCVYDGSPAGIANDVARYRAHDSWQFYGWVENGMILGVCGFEVHADYVEILHIAVAESARRRGIGSEMVTALRKKYEMVIEAETDDDAVEFYRKRGFETTAIQKNNVRRWTCVLPMPKSTASQESDANRRARIYPIKLSEYNPAWPEWFAEEKERLEHLIGVESLTRIYHYGSTSVPGLMAKPTIDVLLEINENTDIDKLIAAMPSPEYICLKGSALTIATPPPHLMYLKGYLPDGFAEKVYHIHVVYPGDHDELRFRDFLLTHPEVAAEYAALKQRLYKDFEHDRDGYTEAKTAFITRITELAKREAFH